MSQVEALQMTRILYDAQADHMGKGFESQPVKILHITIAQFQEVFGRDPKLAALYTRNAHTAARLQFGSRSGPSFARSKSTDRQSMSIRRSISPLPPPTRTIRSQSARHARSFDFATNADILAHCLGEAERLIAHPLAHLEAQAFVNRLREALAAMETLRCVLADVPVAPVRGGPGCK